MLCMGCGCFMRREDVAHGGKREACHERFAMRAEERRNFTERNEHHAGLEQAGEGQDIEW